MCVYELQSTGEFSPDPDGDTPDFVLTPPQALLTSSQPLHN
jgi:hypothetical protein